MTADQQWQAHPHGGLTHVHHHDPAVPHDHTPAAPVAGSAGRESASRWPPSALRASRARRRKVPLWVRALEAWCEHEYPVGRHGYSETRAVVEQVILHYEQEARLKS